MCISKDHRRKKKAAVLYRHESTSRASFPESGAKKGLKKLQPPFLPRWGLCYALSVPTFRAISKRIPSKPLSSGNRREQVYASLPRSQNKEMVLNGCTDTSRGYIPLEQCRKWAEMNSSHFLSGRGTHFQWLLDGPASNNLASGS